MISVVFSWVFIFAIVFIVGFAGLIVYYKVAGIDLIKPEHILITGIIMCTIFAECFSVFYKVGMLAFTTLVTICILIILSLHKMIFCYVTKSIRLANKKKILFAILLMLIIACLTAVPNQLGDTYGYHAQSIRWIEEYGIVKGEGNFQTRNAFNSSFLVLQALFSFKWIVGQSFHQMNGFCAWIMISIGVFTLSPIRKKDAKADFLVSDFMNIAIIIPFVFNYALLSSDSTDFFAMSLTSFILAEWMRCIEQKTKLVDNYAWLIMYIAFCATLKLSCIFIAIPIICYPIICFVKEKNIRRVVLYVVIAMIFTCPFFIRNYYLSGWLVFPFSAVDMFDPVWKVPKETVLNHEFITKWFNRIPYNYKDSSSRVFPDWIILWWRDQNALDLILFILSLASSVAIIYKYIISYSKRKMCCIQEILMCAAMMISLIAWFWSAPVFRFGWAYVLGLIFYGIGKICRKINSYFNVIFITNNMIRKLCFNIVVVSMVLVIIFECLILNKHDMVILQEDYLETDTVAIEKDGIIVYQGLSGYHSFPATQEDVNQWSLIKYGDISEGIYATGVPGT